MPQLHILYSYINYNYCLMITIIGNNIVLEIIHKALNGQELLVRGVLQSFTNLKW